MSSTEPPELTDPTDDDEKRVVVDQTYVVEPNYAGWRLDKYLCQKIPRLSRTRVQEIITRGLLCEEKKLKPSTIVWPGLTFTLRRMMRDEPTVPPPEAVIELYRDDALLVLDKPAGLPIHPTARYQLNTLTGHLKLKYGENFRADPAHRLDRETSGVLVCARTLLASQRLSKAFHDGEVTKEYVAIVEGRPPEAYEVDAPIAEGTELIRVAVRIDQVEGRPALTRFKVERRFARDGADFAVVRCLPETGRQHQIRVHSATAGFPLVGDKMYGPDPGYFDRFSRHCLEPEAWARLRLPRHALHAAKVGFTHPDSQVQVTFEAPLPKDLLAFMG